MVLLQAFTPDTDPLGAQWLSALVAALPIVAMLVTLGVLRWKAHLAGGFSWVIALLVAVTAFGMPITMALSTSAHGFLYGLFPIVWILLTAIWMYDITVVSGRFDDLRRAFFLLSDDPRVLALLIAFCFGGLLESLAGFGAPVAITSAMLLAIGFSPIRAAMTALLANTVPVAFGAVGLPVIMAAKVGELDVMPVSIVSGRMTAILCLVVPFLLLAVMDGKRGVKEVWPFGLVVAATFAAMKWIVSASPLFNLTEAVAAIVSVAVAIVFLKFWKPRGGETAVARVATPIDAELEKHLPTPATPSDADAAPLTTNRILMALVPYALVIVVFGIAALPQVKAALVSTDIRFAWPLLGEMMNVAGENASHQTFTFAWASTPGILLAFVAIVVGLIYRLSLGTIVATLLKNAKKLRYSALTIGSVVALAYVMGDSGQTLALGLFIAMTGALYPFFAPILGWIGTYVTGSDTSANILFSGLQSGVGQEIGGNGAHLDVEQMRTLLVGGGGIGGVVGKMISPQSLSVASTSIALPGSESAILRRMIPWSLVLLVLLCILSGLMSTPVLSWLLP
ncbi:L-lactate permease [Propioniciclava sp. MC1683]|uniref:L-lactate permease n=1 Tax=Propioniciclava sp. MC1683 TaxID=2760309 RepID=UPI001602EA99|nr:L-lactate permease [Propioniciclava sp. MC1683]MBB1502780.1 L-lactate permease [Propioniciclava sp. MC1683]